MGENNKQEEEESDIVLVSNPEDNLPVFTEVIGKEEEESKVDNKEEISNAAAAVATITTTTLNQQDEKVVSGAAAAATTTSPSSSSSNIPVEIDDQTTKSPTTKILDSDTTQKYTFMNCSMMSDLNPSLSDVVEYSIINIGATFHVPFAAQLLQKYGPTNRRAVKIRKDLLMRVYPSGMVLVYGTTKFETIENLIDNFVSEFSIKEDDIIFSAMYCTLRVSNLRGIDFRVHCPNNEDWLRYVAPVFTSAVHFGPLRERGGVIIVTSLSYVLNRWKVLRWYHVKKIVDLIGHAAHKWGSMHQWLK